MSLSLLEACEWLQALPWASGIKESDWQFPAIESVHSLALAGLIWPAALWDMRLLGIVMRKRTVSSVAAQFLPWVWVSFVVMIITGVMLFACEAVKCYNSPFFLIKMSLIALAGLNALVFQKLTFRTVGAWEETRPTPPRARLAGICSLVFWVGVVVMGRALAYA